MKATTQLRSLLTQGPVIAPGCFDALSARLTQSAGFDAVYITGFGVEASQIGAPDLGIITQSELVHHLAHITSAVQVPVITDVDAGFGGVLNIQRTVRELERIGIAGMQLEDQAMPKRCPLLAGRKLVSREEGVKHVKAAVAAKSDPDFLIIGRSDGDEISFEEAVTRAQMYLEAGADIAMPMMLRYEGRNFLELEPEHQMDLHRKLARAVDGPMVAMNPPDGYKVSDMIEAGYSVVVLPGTTLMAATNAMAAQLRSLKEDDDETTYFQTAPRVFSAMEIMQMLGLDDYLVVDKEFG